MTDQLVKYHILNSAWRSKRQWGPWNPH